MKIFEKSSKCVLDDFSSQSFTYQKFVIGLCIKQCFFWSCIGWNNDSLLDVLQKLKLI